MRFIFFFFLFFFSIPFLVCSLSVIPSGFIYDYNPGEYISTSFTISGVSNEGVEFSFDSDFDNSTGVGLKIDGPNKLTNCNPSCIVTISGIIPEYNDRFGKIYSYLRVKEFMGDDEFINGAVFVPSIRIPFRTFISYPGVYGDFQSFFPKNDVFRYELGDNIIFFAEFINLGSELLIPKEAWINIQYLDDPSVENLTLPLEGFYENLLPDWYESLHAKWETSGYLMGDYGVTAYIDYGEEIIAEKTLPTISVGSENVEIISMKPTTFNSGELSKLSLYVENKWIAPLTVFFSGFLLDEDFNNLTETTSKTYNLINGLDLESFLDLTEVSSGNYSLNISVFFNGLEAKKSFNVTVMDKEVGNSEISSQIKSGSDTLFDKTVLIIISLIVIIAILIYLGVKKYRSSITTKDFDDDFNLSEEDF